jgi:plastocyanin
MMWRIPIIGLALGLALAGDRAAAQQATVAAHIEIKGNSATKQKKPALDASEVVIWLNRFDSETPAPAATDPARKRIQLVQKNKSFQPHLLVVPVGSMVDFPNRDPFFHNVFSLFDGKRFDLGLHESGVTNSVRFDRLGVSFLFCNIHPEMSAVVVAVDTNYFGVSDRSGNISIPDVPDGRYQLHVWYERSLPEDLKALSRAITVSSPATDLGTIGVPANPDFSPMHKNKYGQEYTPPPATPGYSHP